MYDDQCQFSWIDIFLCVGVDYVEVVDVNFVGKNGGGEIGGYDDVVVEVWCFINCDIINGFVWVVVQIGCFWGQLLFVYWFYSVFVVDGDFCVDNVWCVVFFCFFDCVGCLVIGVYIVSDFFIVEDVQWDFGELVVVVVVVE